MLKKFKLKKRKKIFKYVTICSGIEAPSVAWHDFGWEPQWFSEIEDFPCAVLKHYYPNVPNLGDMTKLKDNKTFLESEIDLIIGGTPCQSFSIAGLRGGLEDERGNLALEFVRILEIKQPRYFIWENVPGVLSSEGGEDFRNILRAFAEVGNYGLAWRIIDSRYYGVPQRRRRVFVVGCLRNWQRATEILFEPESLLRDSKPSKKKRKEIAADVTESVGTSGKPIAFDNTAFGQYGDGKTASTVKARDYKDATDLVVGFNSKLHVHGDNISPSLLHSNYKEPMAVAYRTNSKGDAFQSDQVHALTTMTDPSSHLVQSITFTQNDDGQSTGALSAQAGMKQQTFIKQESTVRRLMPIETERLQGFSDNWTNIPYKNKMDSPDTCRYKAVGNSMAVPVIRWIGQRIKKIEDSL